MGTFHDHTHELHGITVVVDTTNREIFIGRCETVTDQAVLLNDVDVHQDGDGGRSKEEYVQRAAQLGIWKKHDRLVIPLEIVTSIRRLGEI